MLVKFVLLLFCCALINAKTLVRRDPRHETKTFGREKIQHYKFPISLEEIGKFGMYPGVQAEQDDIDEKDKNESADDVAESEEEEEEEEEKGENEEKETIQKEDVKKDDNEEDDQVDEESEEEEKQNNNENNKVVSEESVQESEDDEEKNQKDAEKKDEENAEEEKVEEDFLEFSSEEEALEQPSNKKSRNKNARISQTSGAFVANKNKRPETFEFPKQQFNVLSAPLQKPTNNQPASTIDNLFDLETLTKNLLPLKKFLPKNNLNQEGTDSSNDLSDDLLIQKMAEFESKSNIEDEIDTNDQNPRIDFDLDNPSVSNFISQAIPKNFQNFQTKFQKLQNMVLNNVNQHSKPLIQKDSKVGFGGWTWNKLSKPMFGNLTDYTNNAVKHAQTRLEENGRRIEANNPPLTINLIPGTPVIFKLKFVEGAHTIDTYGQSKAIRYNKLYAFAQCKFTELRYYYDVIVKPLNLFAVRKSITVILNDAPTRTSLVVENDTTMKLLGLEFVNPDVTVDTESNRFVDYVFNHLFGMVHPVIKQKLVEVVSRDSKMLLADYLKDAQ